MKLPLCPKNTSFLPEKMSFLRAGRAAAPLSPNGRSPMLPVDTRRNYEASNDITDDVMINQWNLKFAIIWGRSLRV